MSIKNNNKFNSSQQKSTKYYFQQPPPPYYLFNKQKINLKNTENLQNKNLILISKNISPQQFLALCLPLLFSLFVLALLIGAIIIVNIQLLNSTKINSVFLKEEIEINKGKDFIFDEKQLKRMRRQTIPADNVRVYATNSNVSVADRIQVLSGESRIQLIEPHLNATIWSNASLLQMAPNGREVALSASRAISLNVELSGGARVEGIGDNLQLNESNRIYDNQTEIDDDNTWRAHMAAELAGDKVNLSWLDANETLKIRAFDARKIGLISLDWQRPNQPEEISILSAPAPINGITERELSIVADSPTYQLQIRLIGAETALQFRDALIEIPSPHHTLTIHWRGWRVDIYSLQSPFEVRALAGSEMLRINCYQEALTVDVFADSINVDVKRLSRLLVNRSSSFPPSLLRVNGAQISSPLNDNNESNNNIIDLAELLSRQLHLALSRDGNQNNSSAAVLADARNSQLKLARANRTTATLTALRHFVEMLGGQPQLQLLAGNVSVRMSAGHDEEIFFLDTKILPRELLEPEATLEQDPFGIGPIVPTVWPIAPDWQNTVSTPSITSATHQRTRTSRRPITSSSRTPSSSSTTEETTTTEELEKEGESTMQMARPSELFNFRHSFPTTNTSFEIEEDKTNISQDLDSFPSPQQHLFTFSPPFADFLVGQFETPAQNVNLNNSTIPSSSQNTNNNSFPISATISALQIPPTLEEDQKLNEAVYEDFPGIRRENRQKPEFIWRPEENQKDEKINDVEEEDEENEDLLENKNNISFNEKLRKKRRDAKTTNFDIIERVEENKLENNSSDTTIFNTSNKNINSTKFPHQQIVRSPALKAIITNSLPILPIGLLALGISLAIMLASLRPSNNAIKGVRRWLKNLTSKRRHNISTIGKIQKI